jgi:hypothetical protein
MKNWTTSSGSAVLDAEAMEIAGKAAAFDALFEKPATELTAS